MVLATENYFLLPFPSDNPSFGHQRSVYTMSNKVTGLGAKLKGIKKKEGAI